MYRETSEYSTTKEFKFHTGLTTPVVLVSGISEYSTTVKRQEWETSKHSTTTEFEFHQSGQVLSVYCTLCVITRFLLLYFLKSTTYIQVTFREQYSTTAKSWDTNASISDNSSSRLQGPENPENHLYWNDFHKVPMKCV